MYIEHGHLTVGFDVAGFYVGGEDHYSQNANRGDGCSVPVVDLSRNGEFCFGENGTLYKQNMTGDDSRYLESVHLLCSHFPPRHGSDVSPCIHS